MKQKFKEFFKKRLKKKKNIDNTNTVRNDSNYINRPPYGAEGTTLTPGSN